MGVKIHKDLANITDSMLLESGTVVAEYHNEEENIHLSLEVVGNIALTFKGKNYYGASEFSDELRNLIEAGYYQRGGFQPLFRGGKMSGVTPHRPLFSKFPAEKALWTKHPDLEIRSTNWFEVFEVTKEQVRTGRAWSEECDGYEARDIEELFLEIESKLLERGVER